MHPTLFTSIKQLFRAVGYFNKQVRTVQTEALHLQGAYTATKRETHARLAHTAVASQPFAGECRKLQIQLARFRTATKS